jgi:hypothetical protein
MISIKLPMMYEKNATPQSIKKTAMSLSMSLMG